MSDKARLFIGSPVEGKTQAQILRWFEDWRDLGQVINRRLKWTVPENLHLTWLFLGDVPRNEIPGIENALGDALAGHLLLNGLLERVALSDFGLTCWLQKTPELLQTAGLIRGSLPEHKPDKPFNPHLTLARIKGKDRKKPKADGFPMQLSPPVIWPVEQIVLYQSTLTPEGPIYDPIWSQTIPTDS